MADAKVIPFDEDSRGRRGGGRSRSRTRKAAPPAAKAADRAADQNTDQTTDQAADRAAGLAADRAAGKAAADQAPLSAVPEVAEIPAQVVPGEQGEQGGARVARPPGARPARERESKVTAEADPEPRPEPNPEAAREAGPEAAADAEGAADARAPAAGRAVPRAGMPQAPGGTGVPAGPGEPEPPSLAGALSGIADQLFGGSWERKAASGLAFLRRRVTGEYEVDEFGYDAELTEQVLMPLFRPLFERYFRVEVKGVENIPSQGGALVVCNHSGTLPWDGVMAQIAVRDHHPAGRHLRLLAADLVFALPGFNELARKGGHTLACTEDAQLLLERGDVVGVMPEGFKGLGKPFAERYKLQRFGRGGFVATALKTGKPIVPCSIVGAEEIYPMLGDLRTLARLLGIPYFPLTPTFPWLGPLGAIPLPTKWTIQFGEPIATDTYPAESADDPMLVFNLTDQVRETIQHTLYELLVQRRSVFF